MNHHRSAAILAGGQATRFGGRDKSALVVDGRSILARQLGTLAAVADEVMIVGTNTASAECSGAVPRRIDDIVPGCGPLGGVHAALTQARADAVFVVACDMPYIEPGFIAYLFTLAASAAIVVPQ